MTRRRPAAALAGAGLAAGAARGAYQLLRRHPPGGAARWARTNHRGEPVTLLEGPAVAAGAALAGDRGPAWPGPGPGQPGGRRGSARAPSAATTTWRAAAAGADSAVTWARSRTAR